jgi:hypothetical protein
MRAFLLISLLVSVAAFGVQQNKPSVAPQEQHDNNLSRFQFLQVMTAGATALTMAPQMSAAKEDPSLKGTKLDPAFEACLSQCMYECTKPKGAEQKSRKECLPECRKSCATTKAQMLKGEPVSASQTASSS